jgi:hypothetical protein
MCPAVRQLSVDESKIMYGEKLQSWRAYFTLIALFVLYICSSLLLAMLLANSEV